MSKLSHSPSTGKLDANIHRSAPKAAIASVIMRLFSCGFHLLPATPMPDILIAVFGWKANSWIADRHLLRPIGLRSDGSPV